MYMINGTKWIMYVCMYYYRLLNKLRVSSGLPTFVWDVILYNTRIVITVNETVPVVSCTRL